MLTAAVRAAHAVASTAPHVLGCTCVCVWGYECVRVCVCVFLSIGHQEKKREAVILGQMS
jgi:hypothetical protein